MGVPYLVPWFRYVPWMIHGMHFYRHFHFALNFLSICNHECWFIFSPCSASVLFAGPGLVCSPLTWPGLGTEMRGRLMTPGPHNHNQPASEQTWPIVTQGTLQPEIESIGCGRIAVYYVIHERSYFSFWLDVKVNNNDSTWLQPPASQGQLQLYYLEIGMAKNIKSNANLLENRSRKMATLTTTDIDRLFW